MQDKGYFKEAVSILHLSQNSNRSVSSVLRADLQLACCYYCLSNFSKACEMILHIVSVLPCGAEPCARDIGVSGLGATAAIPCVYGSRGVALLHPPHDHLLQGKSLQDICGR
ncbi:hypothetical protein LSAT2_029081 [Lamellibrachia satsuma]|nr:hypothetical protein LSAT2_029081 [Lamellibrachia satsuma]